MMLLLSVAAVAVAVGLLLPTVADAAAALVRSSSSGEDHGTSSSRYLVLVPAHDEEVLLPVCLASLGEATRENRVSTVVVADNCGDRTPRVAASMGVACLEREDRARPGKARAIQWALGRLSIREYDAVVIIDADTSVEPDFFDALDAAGDWCTHAGQARQRVSNATMTALTRLGRLFAEVRYGIVFPLKSRAGLNCPLTGSGTILGSEILHYIDWTHLGVAEDLESYAVLTAAGVRIRYVPRAVVQYSEEPALATSSTQRKRWTAGRLRALSRRLGPLILARKPGLLQKLDALAELIAPGPVEHVIVVLVLVASLMRGASPFSTWIQALLIVSLVRPSIYALVAVARDASPGRAFISMLFLPAYLVWRAFVAVAGVTVFVKQRWDRTERSSRSSP